MTMLRFLGTGAGLPDPKRNTSAILVEGNRGGLLLDAGEGFARRLRETDQWSQEIRTMVITHIHADHLAGLPMYLMGCKARRRELPLEILCPEELIKPLQGFLDCCHLGKKHQKFRMDYHPLRPDDFIIAAGHEAEVVGNDHMPEDEDENPTSFSFIFRESGGHLWLYSSDLGNIESISMHFSKIKGLILEATHINMARARRLLNESKIPNVFFTHFPISGEPEGFENVTFAYENLTIDTTKLGA